MGSDSDSTVRRSLAHVSGAREKYPGTGPSETVASQLFHKMDSDTGPGVALPLPRTHQPRNRRLLYTTEIVAPLVFAAKTCAIVDTSGDDGLRALVARTAGNSRLLADLVAPRSLAGFWEFGLVSRRDGSRLGEGVCNKMGPLRRGTIGGPWP